MGRKRKEKREKEGEREEGNSIVKKKTLSQEFETKTREGIRVEGERKKRTIKA